MHIHIVMMSYDAFSYHTDHAEAVKYAADLHKMYPEEDIEIYTKVIGRKEDHRESPVWGVETVYDFYDRNCHQTARTWIWPSQICIPTPQLNSWVSRYIVCLGIVKSSADELEKDVKRFYKDYEVVESKDNFVLLKKK